MDDTEYSMSDGQRFTENMQTALAIIKLIDDLERVDPGEVRQIEAPTLYVLARRAAASGHGPEVLAIVEAGLAEGERDRSLDDSDTNGDGTIRPIVGHA